MDKTGILGQALGQLGDTAKKTGEELVKTPGDLVEEAVEQTGVNPDSAKSNANNQVKSPQVDSQSAQDTKDVVKSLYEKTDNKSQPQQPVSSEFRERIADKSPKEQKELLELRKILHEKYYDSTFNPVKKKQEERPAEKMENEKKKEMYDLEQKKTEKPPPLAVQRAQNKTETFPGASG